MYGDCFNLWVVAAESLHEANEGCFALAVALWIRLKQCKLAKHMKRETNTDQIRAVGLDKLEIDALFRR
jgi:hypothetical protein